MRLEMSSADLNESDIDAVVAVLRSGRLALGPKTVEFESAIADYTGVKYAIAVSSGTAALHLIVRALGIGLGDEVIVPSFTFAASANAFLFEGARPRFVDIEAETYNLDPEDVEQQITPRTRAIMVVDVFGQPAEWEALEAIAAKHNLLLIDDCCEAIGAEYRGKRLGAFGQAGAFAFYPNKQMTTGEGGIITTNSEEIARICRSLRNQGRDEMGAWLTHVRLGHNYRITEMSAALGLSQLKRLESFVEKRAQVAHQYRQALADIPGLKTPFVRSGVRMSWFVYVVTLPEGTDRDEIIARMDARGVAVRGYFAPLHRQQYMKPYLLEDRALPVTENIAARSIALPFHNNLSRAEIDYVAAALRAALLNEGP